MSSTDDARLSPAPLRVGLIGCGKMGLHHLKAIAATRRATVVGVADPAPPDEVREALGSKRLIVSTPAELFDRARPEVVHVVTPPATHAELALQALDAGCHVYVEKPFTLTKADAERVLGLARERGLRVCAGHQVLFDPPSIEIRKHLDSIGRLVHVQSYFSFRMVRRTITRVDQTKDILPHAVYPVVEHLRLGTAVTDEPIEIVGVSVDASGEVYALTRLGEVVGVISVTLNGRPVEQYHHVVGTNGSLTADLTAGAIRLVGQGAGPGALLTPFRRLSQTLFGATRATVARFTRGSYPGLAELLARFYDSIRGSGDPPLSPQSIVDTVDLCERIGAALDRAEQEQEQLAKVRLRNAERLLPSVSATLPAVLVTGGTGLLGRAVAEELRSAGHAVRVVARRVPAFSASLPGVGYIAGDLGRGLDISAMDGIGVVVHCAAETAGGKGDHQRNSIDATRRLIELAADRGVRCIVHVSSLAVLKTSKEMGRELDEATPVDPSSLSRGPYVWGKAESETLARQRARELGVPLKVIRPGPLVDYDAFQPPGRLGREVGPWFFAIGPRRGPLSVCDVTTAARVIRSYVQDFEAAPESLNMVEAPPPRRGDLMTRFLTSRPDLRVVWIPGWLLRLLSGPLKLAQRIVLGTRQPIDVAAAFASERYRTDLAAQVIRRAGPSVRAGHRA